MLCRDTRPFGLSHTLSRHNSLNSCRDTTNLYRNMKSLSLDQAPVATLTSCLGRLSRDKGTSVAIEKKTLSRHRGGSCRYPAPAYSLGTMSQHKEPCRNIEPESSVATEKTSVATQTRKREIASLSLFCSSKLFLFFLNTLNSIYNNLFITNAT